MLLTTGMPGAAVPRPARAAAPTLPLAVPRPHSHASSRGLAARRPARHSRSTVSSPQLPSSRAARTQTPRATQLATYELLSAKSLSTVWFQSCVQKLIGKLGSAPFLHIVQSLPLQQEETVVLGEDVLKSPQAWSTLSQRLASTNPDALFFVHAVDCADDVCPARKATRQQACGSPSSCSTNMAAVASTHDVLAGSVDDCCGPSDGGHTHSTALAIASPVRHSSSSWPAVPHQQQQQLGNCSEQQEQYHGLVVQSTEFKDIEGCYLLKTVTAAHPTGCRCTHFTLTKVCAGVPLLTQLQRSWLVGPGC